MYRWFSIGCYCVSIVLVIFILQECQPRIIEQQQIIKNLKSQNLSPAEFQEQKKRLFKQLSLQSTFFFNPKLILYILGEVASSGRKKKKAKLKINYIMVYDFFFLLYLGYCYSRRILFPFYYLLL